jgi:hypothetical protein
MANILGLQTVNYPLPFNVGASGKIEAEFTRLSP